MDLSTAQTRENGGSQHGNIIQTTSRTSSIPVDEHTSIGGQNDDSSVQSSHKTSPIHKAPDPVTPTQSDLQDQPKHLQLMVGLPKPSQLVIDLVRNTQKKDKLLSKIIKAKTENISEDMPKFDIDRRELTRQSEGLVLKSFPQLYVSDAEDDEFENYVWAADQHSEALKEIRRRVEAKELEAARLSTVRRTAEFANLETDQQTTPHKATVSQPQLSTPPTTVQRPLMGQHEPTLRRQSKGDSPTTPTTPTPSDRRRNLSESEPESGESDRTSHQK